MLNNHFSLFTNNCMSHYGKNTIVTCHIVGNGIIFNVVMYSILELYFGREGEN